LPQTFAALFVSNNYSPLLLAVRVQRKFRKKSLSARCKTKGVLKQTTHCWYVVLMHIMKKCGCDTEPHFCVFVLSATQQPMEVNFTVHKVARAVKMESHQQQNVSYLF
jgi:hypothetical protein